MSQNKDWKRILYVVGVIAFIIGSIDPLEGSVVIAAGASMIALSTYLTQDRHWKMFLASLIMIITGTVCLFYFSALGGFGGSSELSWWWATLILPYPIGWIINVVLFIVKGIRKRKENT